MKLHGYFRSTASHRVRIALNLKQLEYSPVSHHLRKGEQRDPRYLSLNPQGLVPSLELSDGQVLSQSLAICEYLDEIAPTPPLFPKEAVARARVRAFAQVIACDTHPLQNLRVLARLRALGHGEDVVNDWAAAVIEEGLSACAALIAHERGPFCFGESVTLADVCLVPQLVNARRFGVALRWSRLLEVEHCCLALEEFSQAAPEAQEDAE